MKVSEQKIAKANGVIGKISNSLFIKVLMGGMMASMPAIMAGAFATILKSIQIPAYQNFLKTTGALHALEIIILFTINMTALYTVFAVAYTYAKGKKQDALPAGILGLVCYFVMTPFTATPTQWGTVDYAIPTSWFGGQGAFSALVIGFTVGAMYSFIKKKGWTIKLPDTVPPVISSSFSGIVPGVIIVGFFATVSTIFSNTPFGSFHQAIYSLLQMPLQGIGTNIWTIMLVVMISQALWMLGIHGPMVVIPIMAVAWGAADIQNLTAYNAGQALPHITGTAFYMVCTFSGGGLGLAINMLFAKSKRYKTLGKLAIIPSAFGITEPLIFGTPIVMNLKMFIPQVFAPVISIALGYLATISGILPRMSGLSLPMGTPIVLQGLLEGSWKFGAFQAFLTLFWIAVYRPFFRSMDKDALREEQVQIEE